MVRSRSLTTRQPAIPVLLLLLESLLLLRHFRGPLVQAAAVSGDTADASATDVLVVLLPTPHAEALPFSEAFTASDATRLRLVLASLSREEAAGSMAPARVGLAVVSQLVRFSEQAACTACQGRVSYDLICPGGMVSDLAQPLAA
jgi:hypothetical protein